MTYVGHTLGGVLAACIAGQTLPVEQGAMVGMVAATVLGALAPDLDHQSSYLSRRLWPVRLMLGLLLSNPITWLMAGGRPPERKESTWRLWRGRARVRRLLAHRQLTHALLGLVGGTLIWLAIAYGLWVGAGRLSPALATWMGGRGGVGDWLVATTYGWALGWASHIILDAMTVSGVPLFLPLSPRRCWVLPSFLRVRSTA